MAATKKNELDETLIYGQENPCDTLESLGKAMEFMSDSIFAMLAPSNEHLEFSKEGLHHLLQHMTSLIKHATNECKGSIEVVQWTWTTQLRHN
ncbi:MAG: hypothetical protein HRT35_07645 [Algicola sp.]|nr:hypothetical protein [Algicola sp.]